MKKLEIISLSGDLAAGKGAVSRVLMEKLGFGIYRNGDYFRKLAKEKGMSVTEFSEYVSGHPEIDEAIEKSASLYALDHDKFIIDARLGFYAVPNSFKVYLKVDIDVASERAFNDPDRKETERFDSVLLQKEDLIKRSNLERERYLQLYGVDKSDMNNYDLVIDTSDKSILEVADLIISGYKKWIEN